MIDGLLVCPVFEPRAEIRIRRVLLTIRKSIVGHIHRAGRIQHCLEGGTGLLFRLPLLLGSFPLGIRLVGLSVLLRRRLRDLWRVVSETIQYCRLHGIWSGRIRRRIRKRCRVRVDRDRPTRLCDAVRPLAVECLLGQRWAYRLSDLGGRIRLTVLIGVLHRTIQDDRPGEWLLSTGIEGTRCESNTGQKQDSFRNHRSHFAIERANIDRRASLACMPADCCATANLSFRRID